MSEEKIEEETKEVGEEVTTPVEDDRPEPKNVKNFEERKKEAEDEKELLNLEEENKARRQTEGRANAGAKAIKPKEETDEEYKNRIMSGQ